MVNELRDLLRDNVAQPPADDQDLGAVVRGGRRRVRRRRLSAVGGTALAGVAVLGLTSFLLPSAPDLDAAGVPAPAAPTLRLADARAAIEGRDYRVLASHTNENLDADNGQYFDGVTDDGLVLFRDGPRMEQLRPRYALMDPDTGEKEWLPDPGTTRTESLAAVDLGADRLVFTGVGFGGRGETSERKSGLFALVYDRGTREWTRTDWDRLPAGADPAPAQLGPDDRLYVRVPATAGEPPEGGWPTGPDGEAEDADAEGDTYRLWSVALSDEQDVRDERLTLGDLAFTEASMVWTDATNGDSGQVHVRDLETGKEHAFDPASGERCNLLSFGATDEHVVMGQYCGTYEGGVRDDRVQVVTTDGDQVVTLQDSSIDGLLAAGTDVVTVTSYEQALPGTFVYDLDTGRFLRVSDDVSQWLTGGPSPERHFLWNTPAGGGKGATQHLGVMLE